MMRQRFLSPLQEILGLIGITASSLFCTYPTFGISICDHASPKMHHIHMYTKQGVLGLVMQLLQI